MAEKRLEKIKLYLVIVLALVFIVVAYFRLTGAKSNGVEPMGSAEYPPVEEIKIASLQTKTKKPQIINSRELAIDRRIRTALRDVFSPPNLPKKEKNQDSDEPSRDPDEFLKLAGTIVGGKNPIAIINDQFVRAGDWIGEFKVIRIGKTDVLLMSDDHRLVLEIMKNE